jgi:hypothetical protein
MLTKSKLGIGLAAMTAGACWLAYAAPDKTHETGVNATIPGTAPALVRKESAMAGGQNVLHYEDLTLGVSAYTDALNALGWSFTLTSDPGVFAAELASGDYTHVIAAHQNSFAAAGWEDALTTWIGNNPGSPVLISDWRVNNPQPYLAAAGFAYGGNTNAALIRPGGCLEDLGSADLVSPGWGIFSYDVAGPELLALNELGTGAIASNGEGVCFNGFLSDTFGSAAQGRDYVVRQLTECHDPDPCSDCPCPEDINRDGTVDTADLVKLLAAWGDCEEEAYDCDNPGRCDKGFEACDETGECICFTRFDGSGYCQFPQSCGDLFECAEDGSCPPGFVCVVDDCCGFVPGGCVTLDAACDSITAPDYPPGTRTQAGVYQEDGTYVSE